MKQFLRFLQVFFMCGVWIMVTSFILGIINEFLPPPNHCPTWIMASSAIFGVVFMLLPPIVFFSVFVNHELQEDNGNDH